MSLLLGALWLVVHQLVQASGDALGETGRFGLQALLDAGAKDDVRVAEGELHRLVRAGLVHVNVGHALVNSLGLLLCMGLVWRIAPLETRHMRRAAALVAVAVIASTAGFGASFLAYSGTSCGASAAIFGYLGAAAGSVWMTTAIPQRRLIGAGLATLGLAMGLVFLPKNGVDHVAHLGGWAAGLCCGLALESRHGPLFLGSLALGLVALGIAG
jgi:membrane associated rhomboid family serine protease